MHAIRTPVATSAECAYETAQTRLAREIRAGKLDAPFCIVRPMLRFAATIALALLLALAAAPDRTDVAAYE